MLDDQSALEQARAAERMRIAQSLHDTTMQLLALLQLTLSRMRRQGVQELDANIGACEEMVSQIGRQMREICKGDPS